jgi:lycopene beta-cyclase
MRAFIPALCVPRKSVPFPPLVPPARPRDVHRNSTISCDLAILGGGLAGGLIASALAAKRPDLDVRIVDSGPALGDNHVWSFFDSDIAAEDRWLVEPMIVHRWNCYDVAFPAHRRTIPHGYNAIESDRFDSVLRAQLGPDRIIPAKVESAHAGGAVLADGAVIEAKGVIDARGPGDVATLDLGWQKFVGQLLRLNAPHGLAHPIVMDATVDQIDGYRFVYCLPFGPDAVFVEDTYYSDGPALDVAAVSARIAGYSAAQGWQVHTVERQETGVLPVVVGGSFDAYWESTGSGIAKAGMRAGLFHPTTGYSLPDAVRLASLIARSPDLSGAALATLTHDHAQAAWKKRGFYRMLDTMLFRAAFPAERYRIMEKFYRLDDALIARFYAAHSTPADMVRILTGKPPIPIPRALGAIFRSVF